MGVGENLAKSNQHAILPSQYIRLVVDLCFKDCNTRHQDCRSFLVATCGEPAPAKLRALVVTRSRCCPDVDKV